MKNREDMTRMENLGQNTWVETSALRGKSIGKAWNVGELRNDMTRTVF